MADINSINVEEIIASVAKKHKTIISESDPILLTVFLQEEINKHFINNVNKEMATLKKELNIIYNLQEEQAKKVVRTVMTECLEVAKESLEQSAKKAADDIKTALRTQQNLVVNRTEKVHRDITMSRNISLTSCIICLASMTTVLMVLLLK